MSIFILPPELIIEVLEVATAIDYTNTPFALALVCKAISQLVNHILYQTVVLSSPKSISLFFRTTTSKPPCFLTSHIRRILVTVTELSGRVKAQLVGIVKACTGPQAVMDLDLAHHSHSARLSPACSFELHLQSYVDLSDESILISSASGDYTLSPLSLVTHLRICEPGYVWQAPSSLLPPHTSNLTHLHICRRAFANEENDAVFLKDVHYFLRSSKMKMVVVSVFPSYFANEMEEVNASSIWQALKMLQAGDERLFVLEGKHGSWTSECVSRIVAGLSGPLDFWQKVRRSALGPQ